MRIALVTQAEPFYLPPAIDSLCSQRGQDIVALIILPAFNETLIDNARRLYEFYGPSDFIKVVRRFIWTKLASTLNIFFQITRPYTIREIGQKYGIPVYEPANLNSPTFFEELKSEIYPDLIISVAASQVFKKIILDIPKLGSINLHSAPLPRYQGMMPNFWMMLNDEAEGAVTVHLMAEKLDAGEILVQLPVPIYPSDSLHDLMVRSKKMGVQALLQAVDQIERGTAQPRSMHMEQATYFSFPKRDDVRKLRQKGRSLL
jgi:methionyl-tRNA formyltransferase